jgi:hypothetical protein
MHGLDRLIIENRMRIEAADIFVIALIIIVAMGQEGLELLEAMRFTSVFLNY